MSDNEERRKSRWYFGGLAGAIAASCTHPLDLLKVHLQTQQTGKSGLLQLSQKVIKESGIRGLFNGVTATISRQLTYSMTRFAVYEALKEEMTKDGKSIPFHKKVIAAALAGSSAGLVGTPSDLVNVRMQNDMKLSKLKRRNYKHALDGLYRVFRHEGPAKAFSGASMASTRAVLVTVGQLACYDQAKQGLLSTGYFEDNLTTHLTASIIAGIIATVITQPLDVMKTRMMNAAPGTYKNIMSCAQDIGSNGIQGFFKGFTPAFTRMAPYTVLLFVVYEQLRQSFGEDPD